MRFPSEASMKFGRNSTTEKSADCSHRAFTFGLGRLTAPGGGHRD
jgi:hypothetical protein